MKDLDLKYGFMSTYNETFFVRQEQDTITGIWELQYSPVIKHSTSADLRSNIPSLRQCIWYVARCAEAMPYVQNNTPSQRWVKQLRTSR